MPRPLTRVLAAAALAVPVLTGVSAVSASACDDAPAETTTAESSVVTEQTAPSEQAAPAEETAPSEGPVLFEAAYTRW